MVFTPGCPIFRSATAAIALIALSATSVTPAFVTIAAAQSAQPKAQGPASVADLAEGLLDAVVNISTSQIIPGVIGRRLPDLKR